MIQIPRPAEREFIVDKADLITPEHEQQIKTVCDKLLTDTATPIIVVTVESMATYLKPGRELPWETFARVLFDEWGIGHLSQGNPPNSGILLLVSRDDRKVRIELGTGWAADRDAECAAIVQQIIVPRFRQTKFSDGILEGVQALDRMARSPRGSAVSTTGGANPSAPAAPVYRHSNPSGGGGFPGLGGLGVCGGIGGIVAIIVIFMLIRGVGGALTGRGMGRRGWYGGYGGYGPGFGWGMPWGMGGMGGGFGGWGGGLGGRSGGSGFSSGGGFSGGSGGGFSGGSFGGGFSGGHGASGSW